MAEQDQSIDSIRVELAATFSRFEQKDLFAFVIKGVSGSKQLQMITDGLAEKGVTGAVVIALGPDQDYEILTEKDMARVGWVPARKEGQPLCSGCGKVFQESDNATFCGICEALKCPECIEKFRKKKEAQS